MGSRAFMSSITAGNTYRPDSQTTMDDIDEICQLECLYAVLGVSREASASEIRAAYRSAALRFHPDRNRGDPRAAEAFKRIVFAHSVLSDGLRRAEYDRNGQTNIPKAVNVSELKGAARYAIALLNSLIGPIPTAVSPKVLASAQEFASNDCGGVRPLCPNSPVSGRLERQTGAFFVVEMLDEYREKGVAIRCVANRKLKLLIFDREGGIRRVDESEKRGRNGRVADLFFVPFHTVRLHSVRPPKSHKNLPAGFDLLNGLDANGCDELRVGNHLICVYADTFIRDLEFTLSFVPLRDELYSSVWKLETVGRSLSDMKNRLDKFQSEYLESKKQYRNNQQRLKRETAETRSLMRAHSQVRNEIFQTAVNTEIEQNISVV